MFSKEFSGDDSVLIFETDMGKTIKYGNAIHRDKDLLFFS
jgi:CRISPR-associated protein Cas2